jgi:guanylate kinase
MSNERGKPRAAEGGPVGGAGVGQGERGRLVVVCAPSGAGKSSLVALALARIDRLRFSISYTTRGPRAGEREGVNYFFVGKGVFQEMRERGEFLESAEVHGNLYATCRTQIEALLDQGLDVILDIDVQGAAQIRSRIADSITVFVLPPSRDVLERRLRLRNVNDAEDLERRLRNASYEVKMWDSFDYVIVNDDLDRAYGQLEAIIIAERSRPQRQPSKIREIIDTFKGE